MSTATKTFYAPIAIVDENDNEIGSGELFSSLMKNDILRVIRVFLIDREGLILMQQRGGHVIMPYRWCSSVAGLVDAGETYEHSAVRELSEELGLSGIPLWPVAHYLGVESFQEPRTDNVLVHSRRFNTIYVGAYDGSVELSTDEVEDVKWVTQDELKEWAAAKPDDFTEGVLEALQYVDLLNLRQIA